MMSGSSGIPDLTISLRVVPPVFACSGHEEHIILHGRGLRTFDDAILGIETSLYVQHLIHHGQGHYKGFNTCVTIIVWYLWWSMLNC